MKNRIYPCLWFDGNAKESADFHCSVFQNAKILDENPMVATYELEGFKFLALNGGPQFSINPSISFFVNCDSADEVETKFSALSADGMELMPLDEYPWSKKYGWCQDKYGVNWQLMLGDIGGQKIVPAFMFANKQAGRAEDAMNFYTGLFENSGTVDISRYGPDEGDVEGTIKHGRFTLDGHYFVAMDSSAAPFKFGEGVSIVVDCDTQQEIDYFWDKFTAEGEESRCGWLKDKYGVSWQIVPSFIGELMSDPERARNVGEVLMQMKKLDIETLMKA